MRVIAAVFVAALALLAGSNANVVGNSYGNRNARVTIEVFSDFQCPACKLFHDEAFQQILKDFVVPGKVYVIYRYFPLVMHQYGRPCAEFACAASRIGRYQKVADVLFDKQSQIESSGKVEETVDSILTPTERQKVHSLLKSPEVQRQIQTDLDEGRLVPVNGTPTLWVTCNGKSQAVSWPMNYELFKSYLNSLLAAK